MCGFCVVTLTCQSELKAGTGVGGVPLSQPGPVRASYFSQRTGHALSARSLPRPGCVRLHRTEWLQGKVLHWTDLYRFAAFIILAEQGLSLPPPSLSPSHSALTLSAHGETRANCLSWTAGSFFTQILTLLSHWNFRGIRRPWTRAPLRLEGCCLLGAFQLRRRLAVGRLDVSALLQIQTPSSIFRLLAHNSSGVNYNAEF